MDDVMVRECGSLCVCLCFWLDFLKEKSFKMKEKTTLQQGNLSYVIFHSTTKLKIRVKECGCLWILFLRSSIHTTGWTKSFFLREIEKEQMIEIVASSKLWTKRRESFYWYLCCSFVEEKYNWFPLSFSFFLFLLLSFPSLFFVPFFFLSIYVSIIRTWSICSCCWFSCGGIQIKKTNRWDSISFSLSISSHMRISHQIWMNRSHMTSFQMFPHLSFVILSFFLSSSFCYFENPKMERIIQIQIKGIGNMQWLWVVWLEQKGIMKYVELV